MILSWSESSAKRHGSSDALICKLATILLFQSSAAFANPSLIGQKNGFNSDKQLSSTTYASYAIDEKSFLSASFTYARTPEQPTLDDTDTFYQGTLTLGYAIHNLGFDIGFNASRSPLQESRVLGGTFGMTFVYAPSDTDSDDYSDTALTALHLQLYQTHPETPPLFWIRLGYIGNTMKTNLLPDFQNSGTETAFTFDFFYPYEPELMLNFGLSFHGYDDGKGFFDRQLKNTTSTEIQLLSSTIQGLPHTTAVLQATWLVVPPLDSFIPRYQATEIDSSRQWAHTIDIGWRHQFTKHIYLTPTYEVSMLQGLPSTAVLVDLLYAF